MRTYLVLLFFSVSLMGLCQMAKPQLEVAEQMEHMSFLIGKWEFHWKNMQPDKSIKDGGISYSHVYPILEGTILCDDFVQQNQQGQAVSGVTLRSFDPAEGKWRMKWIPSGGLASSDFEGGMEDGSFIFWQTGDQEDQYGSYKVRVTFFDIEDTSYRWRTDRLYTNGYLLENVSSYVAYRKE